jgi:Zn-dependent protease with chaperone function
MAGLRRLATVTLVFTILSGIGLVFSHLALTDIWHGEPDPRLEWLILQLTGVLLGIFLCLAFSLSVCIRRATRT